MDSSQRPTDDGTPPTNLADLVAAAAADHPDHPALVDADAARPRALTWAEFDAAVSAEARRLQAAGVRAGDRVAVGTAAGTGLVVAVLGALRAGAVAVPVGGAAPDELARVLADCAPRVVVDVGTAAAADAAVLGPPDLAARGEPLPAVGGGEDLALLLHTSGSPHAVCLSHRAVLANRAQAAALRPAPVTPVDRVLLAQPLFHAYGLAAGLFQICWAGATAVLPGPGRPEPDLLLDVVVRHRVSVLAAGPSTFRALLDRPRDRLRGALAGLRLCTCGGASLPVRWAAAFREETGHRVVVGYGLTEAGPVVTSTPLDGDAPPGALGRVLPGVELRLVDREGRPVAADGATARTGRRDTGLRAAVTGDPVGDMIEDAQDVEGPVDPERDVGFLALRGPNLFSGYWPDRSGGPGPDGWFRTPDVGFLDAAGNLYLVDRSTDLIVVNGFTVFPHEVERVITELDAVAEAAVVAVPDERSGQAVRAVLVRAPGADLDADAVLAHCRTRLARFKVPAEVEFADALPRTPTGKLARRLLATRGGSA